MNAADLYESLALLMARVADQARFRPELARAWREFFGEGSQAAPDGRLTTPAETRFAEWFLLERQSDVVGEVPIRVAATLLGEELPAQAALETSQVGVFAVVSAQQDVLRLADLQSNDTFDLLPAAGLRPAVGDLLIGRLFSERIGLWLPSPAVALVPAAETLNRALRRDFNGVALERRLAQVELERMLFRRSAMAQARVEQLQPVEHVEAQLERLLRDAHALRFSATDISRMLKDSAQAGPVIGPLLEEAAFETDADLDQLRLLLTELWNAHRAADALRPGPAAPPPTPEPLVSGFAPRDGESLGETLARRIEEGERRHEDIEQVYADVERLLGESIEDEDAEQEFGTTSVDEFARGDLQPLVQEFLWEEHCEHGDEARILELLLRQQQQAPVPKVNLEYLEGEDLLRVIVQVFLGSAPADRAVAVRRTFSVLQRFYRWAEATQEYDIGEVLASCQRNFVDDLERVHRASLALSRSAVPDAGGVQPILMRVAEVTGDEVSLQHAASRMVWVTAGDAAADLRSGDVILGALRLTGDDSGSLDGMVVVLPAAAEAVLG